MSASVSPVQVKRCNLSIVSLVVRKIKMIRQRLHITSKSANKMYGKLKK